MKKFLKILWKTVKWTFIVFLVFLLTLFFREQRLPQVWTDMLADGISSSNILVRCDAASFGFRAGVHLSGIRVYDRTKRDVLEPIASARAVYFNYLQRNLKIVALSYPRLPDSYYDENDRESDSLQEMNGFKFPQLSDMRLVLEDPDLLGLRPERVSAQIMMRPNWAVVDELHIDWPDREHRMSLDGFLRVDLGERRLTAMLDGYAMQAQVRPLVETLAIESALPYIDAFTEVKGPVPSHAEFNVRFGEGDFDMKLVFRPELGRYNGVALSSAEGGVELHTNFRDPDNEFRLKVDVPRLFDTMDRRMNGVVAVSRTNGVFHIECDADSSLEFADTLDIVGLMSAESLDMVECYTAPQVSVKGVCGVGKGGIDLNDLAFSARLLHGAVFGMKVNDAKCDFDLIRDTLHFRDFHAKGKTGGRIRGNARLTFPEFETTNADFAIDVEYRDGSLAEAADLFKVDLGDRRGKVDADIDFTGTAVTNFTASLNGTGMVRITDGHIAQMRLFAGLTDMLVKWVPGVDYLVNQSQASANFTVTNGVMESDNVLIEGGVVSIKGWGKYDIVADELDFTVRVQFLKDESLMGKIVHPLTWPFTKLLLEFRATGSVNDPKWDYISLIDRIF